MSQIEVERAAAPALPAAAERAEDALAEEQFAYARLLDAGMKAGMLLLMGTFIIYLLGNPAPHIPVRDLPRYWSLPVNEYLAATGIPTGWGWVVMVGKADFLNFVGIALLSSVTILCYVAIIPIFFRKKDVVFGWLSVIEVLVLALAASGVLTAGGH